MLNNSKELDDQKGDLSDKLLCCPFCGHPAIIYNRTGRRSPPISIACINCSFEHWPQRNSEDAIKRWNTRAPNQQLTQTQRVLDATRHALKIADEGFDLLNAVHGKYADLNLSFADNWYSNVEEFFMHEFPKFKAALTGGAEITPIVTDRQKLDIAVEALKRMIEEFDPELVRHDCCDCNRKDAGARLIVAKAKTALTSIRGK